MMWSSVTVHCLGADVITTCYANSLLTISQSQSPHKQTNTGTYSMHTVQALALKKIYL